MNAEQRFTENHDLLVFIPFSCRYSALIYGNKNGRQEFIFIYCYKDNIIYSQATDSQ